MARTRRNEPRTALSERFSSDNSSTSAKLETKTTGAPKRSSQKIGPSVLAIVRRLWTGAFASTENMLPTTGFFGGWGIGLSGLPDAIAMRLRPILFRMRQRLAV